MELGENIAILRRNKGWTQAELAKAAGLSRGYIAAIEEGGKPSLRALAVIAESLEVEIKQLYGEVEEE